MSIIDKSASFIKEARLETKKVNWPTRQETVKYTLIVVLVSIFIAAFLGGLDYIFQLLINYFII
ncbi:MAG: preprotein translocase subunit SecE [Candidatus Nealsonbacteria bacterium RIFOXYB1_FULL_40_15]|uniref:Protein translocase subunit SecE n=1 Tax=Candidatus Nealsonbacteria bacterium RIFOXYB1_FULL_40_15 TaxID=1801677 RepID=A0A1G2EQY6_9BACT|nr:MAG: preprotein translocase subunit SecE [Candidatus Nealsonbacteria bacterium RIFOXYB1_FULL_40_15]OGZ28614.1 MAG: preprotein translocase subunit SecE [Candidatus Nealsonbacteria bacterium RIFOXYD1_FULL_39_11]